MQAAVVEDDDECDLFGSPPVNAPALGAVPNLERNFDASDFLHPNCFCPIFNRLPCLLPQPRLGYGDKIRQTRCIHGIHNIVNCTVPERLPKRGLGIVFRPDEPDFSNRGWEQVSDRCQHIRPGLVGLIDGYDPARQASDRASPRQAPDHQTNRE